MWFFQNHKWKVKHDPSAKPQAPSSRPHAPIFRKLEAASLKQAIQETVPDIDIEEAKGSSSQARKRSSSQASSGARINKRWI